MSFGNIYQDYHSSEQYIHLMKSGLPLKTIRKEDSGVISTTEVVKVKKRKIPDTDFSPPVNFKLMNLHDLGLWF